MAKKLKKNDKITKKDSFFTGRYFLPLFFVISFVFMFLNLGNIYLWLDETDTALFGRNTLEFGYPKAFDGENLIPSPHVPEVGFETGTEAYNKNMVLISHSWLQYYIEAFSFWIFGYSTFSARILFTLFGFLSLFLIYNLYKKLYPDKKITNLALIILFATTFFFTFSRQSRYYSLALFFTTALLINYINLLKRNKAKDIFLFSICGALLFHSNYLIFGMSFLSLAIHFLFFTKWKSMLKSILLSCLFIIFLTLPWFLYAQPWQFIKGSKIFSLFSLFEIYIFVTQIINFHYPIILLIFLPALLYKLNQKRKKLQNRKTFSDRFLFVFILFPILFFGFLSPLKSYRFLFNFSPLFFLFCSRLFYIFKEKTKPARVIAIAILILLLTSNLLSFVPAYIINAIAEKPIISTCNKFAPAEKQERCGNYITYAMNLGYIKFPIFYYMYEITHDYDGPDEGRAKYLLDNAKKDDIIWAYPYPYAVQFYTGMRILSINEYSEYLNSTENKPDWIIYDWAEGNLAQSLKEYAGKNNYIRIGLDYPDLFNENRPDMHLHRFWTEKDAPKETLYVNPDYKQ